MYNIVTVVLEKKNEKKRLLYSLYFVQEEYYELPAATLRLKNPNHIITSRNGHVSNTVGFRNDETFGTRLRVCTTTSRATLLVYVSGLEKFQRPSEHVRFLKTIVFSTIRVDPYGQRR